LETVKRREAAEVSVNGREMKEKRVERNPYQISSPHHSFIFLSLLLIF
jgi:hypothetical protein